jgi:hypothetical protein
MSARAIVTAGLAKLVAVNQNAPPIRSRPPLRVRLQRTISQKIPTTATKPMVKITVRTNGQPKAKTTA